MSRRPFRVGRSRTGLGLFATKPIRKSTRIVETKAPCSPARRPPRPRAGGNRYLYEINKRWTIDGRAATTSRATATIPATRTPTATTSRSASSSAPSRTSSRATRSSTTTASTTSKTSSASRTASARGAASGATSAPSNCAPNASARRRRLKRERAAARQAPKRAPSRTPRKVPSAKHEEAKEVPRRPVEHRAGRFATETIVDKCELIVEYTGRRISNAEAEEIEWTRANRYLF